MQRLFYELMMFLKKPMHHCVFPHIMHNVIFRFQPPPTNVPILIFWKYVLLLWFSSLYNVPALCRCITIIVWLLNLRIRWTCNDVMMLSVRSLDYFLLSCGWLLAVISYRSHFFIPHSSQASNCKMAESCSETIMKN